MSTAAQKRNAACRCTQPRALPGPHVRPHAAERFRKGFDFARRVGRKTAKVRLVARLGAVKLQKPVCIRGHGRSHFAQLGLRELGYERRAKLIGDAGIPQQREAFCYACGIRAAKRRVAIKRRFVIHGHIVEKLRIEQRAECFRLPLVSSLVR